jgi:HEAT repeat protein
MWASFAAANGREPPRSNSPESHATGVEVSRLVRQALTPGYHVEEQQVRAEAVTAIRRLGPRAAPAVRQLATAAGSWCTDYEIAFVACEALGSLGPISAPAVPELIHALSEPRGALSWQAHKALSRVGEAAVPGLVGLLRKNDSHTKIEAAQILGEIGIAAQPAISALETNLKDPSFFVRAHTANALMLIDSTNQAAIPVLREGLSRTEEEWRVTSAEHLARSATHAKEAAPALIQTLKDIEANRGQPKEAINHCLRCMYALWRIGPSANAGTAVLKKLLLRFETAGGDDFALLAAVALFRIDPKCTEARLFLEKSVPQLTAGLGLQGAGISRVMAADALGRLGPSAAKAVPALRQALKDEKDPEFQKIARAALLSIERSQPANGAKGNEGRR